MTSMAAARRRAETFAAAVDGSRPPIVDAETETFLALVYQLRALDAPAPDPVFAADLRSRLMMAARTDLSAVPVERLPVSRTLQPRRRRVLSVAASACILAGSGLGVAAASQSALPGDALYPVKRGIENAEVSIAASPADRGHEYVDEAGARLIEVQALAITRGDDPSTSALIASTLDDFTVAARKGAEQLITAYRQGPSPQSIAELRAFTRQSAQQLRDLGQSVPADVRDDLLIAAQVLTRIDAAAREACPTCSTLAPLTLAQEFASLQERVSTLQGGVSTAPTTTAPPPTQTAPPTQHKSSATPSTSGPTQRPHSNGQSQPVLPVLPNPPGQNSPPRSGSQQMPTPTVLTTPSGAQSTPTEFTAPPVPSSGLPSASGDEPTVQLPTAGMIAPSDGVPQILDPTAPAPTAPALGGDVVPPLLGD